MIDALTGQVKSRRLPGSLVLGKGISTSTWRVGHALELDGARHWV
jgi:hypothetical protein